MYIRLGLGSIVLLLWYCYSYVFTPFVISLIIAYFCNPIAYKISDLPYSNRSIAAIMIVMMIVTSTVAFGMFVFPLAYEQLMPILYKTPQYIVDAKARLFVLVDKLPISNSEILENIRVAINTLIESTSSMLSEVFSEIWNYFRSTINIVIHLVLIPIILYHFIKDFDKIKILTREMIPSKYRDIVLSQGGQMIALVNSYLRGQLIVCLIMVLYYTSALMLVKIKFSIFLGLMSGMLIVVPFIGITSAFISALIISYITVGNYESFMAICVVYGFGHVIEASMLSPKIIGDSIGIHPVLIIFSVMLFGSMFGFVGLLLAIPITCVIKIFLDFILRYL